MALSWPRRKNSMQTSERPLGQRVASGFKRLVIGLVVAGLLCVVAYLAADRNARTYSFSTEGGALVILKGQNMPWGAEPWKPTDPFLMDAYAPIPLEGTTLDGDFMSQKFSERDELDRALFAAME